MPPDTLLGLMPPDVAPLLALGAWRGALGVLGIAYLLGLALLPRLRAWRDGEAQVLRLAAGLPLASLVVLAVGQVPGWLLRAPWGLVGGLGWVAGVVLIGLDVYRWARDGGGGKDAHTLPSADRVQRWLALAGWGVVGFTLLHVLLPAFCPPLNYDVLEYHLGIIPHIFELGLVRPVPHIFYTAQPLGTELLYTLAAVIEGNAWGCAPGLLHWLLIVLGCVVFALLARRQRLPVGWTPWLLLLLTQHPITFKLQLDRLTDWTGLLMLACGVWVWLGGTRATIRRTAALLGVFVGGALGAKWTNAGTVALPLLLLAFALGWQGPASDSETTPFPIRRRLGRGVATLALCGTVGFLLWLPWGIWLAVLRHNPFAPFLAGWFPSTDWSAAQLHFLTLTHGPLSPTAADYWVNLAQRLSVGLEGPPLVALALVVALATLALDWAERRKGNAVNPGRVNDGLVGWLALGVLGAVLLWGQLRHAADRFLAPVLLASVLILAQGLGWLIRRVGRTAGARRWARRLAGGLLALAALSGAWKNYQMLTESGFTQQLAATALGRQSALAYWRFGLGSTIDLFAAANALPPGSRLIAINEARRYPFRRAISLASVFDSSPIRPAIRGAANAEQIRQRLVRAGYTHLLVNEFEQARLLEMHTPPALLDDPGIKAALALEPPLKGQAFRALAERYRGYAEFATEPLTAAERAVYLNFLAIQRARAVWLDGAPPANSPAFWIAPLN